MSLGHDPLSRPSPQGAAGPDRGSEPPDASTAAGWALHGRCRPYRVAARETVGVHMAHTTVREVLDALAQVDFPAGKDDLLSAAEAAGASGEVLKALRGIPPEEYANRDEVARSVRVDPASDRQVHPCPESGAGPARRPAGAVGALREVPGRRSRRSSPGRGGSPRSPERPHDRGRSRVRWRTRTEG